MGAGGGDLERRHHLGARAHLDGLPRLDAEGGAVDNPSVHKDVTVNHNLASLGDGPGDARAQHQGVQAHLEQLDQGLTGQPLLTPGLLEDALQLRLPDAVLSAQALLLLQTDGVVGFGTTTGATVLARTVGALLEVAHGLGGERNAEGAGQAHLAAGAGGAHEFFFLSEWIACHGRAPAARGQPVFAVAAVFGRDPRTAAAHSGSAGTLPTVGREPHLTIPGCELILSHEASSSCSPLRLGRADEHAPCAAC